MNLLQELKEELKEHRKTIEDIKWIGTDNVYVDIDKFLELADTEYDDGFGGQEVAMNLLIVGDTWWLERHEYDGSEWFEYKEIASKPDRFLELKAVTKGQNRDCYWDTLERLNGIDEDGNPLEDEGEEW